MGLGGVLALAAGRAVRDLVVRQVSSGLVKRAEAKATALTPALRASTGLSIPPTGSELDPLSRHFLVDLHDAIRPLAVQLLREAHDQDFPLVITSGARSLAVQQALWDQGRTKPGKIVTHARPGTSWHNYGLAFDVAPVVDGKAAWPNDLKLWHRIGELGESVGLSWGGRWKVADLPHFEFHPNVTLADAMRGVRPAALR